ncbi:hypothetical protein ISN45_At01g002160 [Arabidopsis thaliana x Arabidopsis arenosa]|uniref:Uncharacterized protein n=2 Tax=Arabidopsis TaxID=3701 RepID=A0A8T2GYM2_ARASU|nr:hypothetical protein ISN45_At01g002160 [Arabidopsis thaliana x Arabidopsis arenosa]KAG7652871.1 hypothetical protein ISN44_As01g002030 [Arabidopsis suecica]
MTVYNYIYTTKEPPLSFKPYKLEKITRKMLPFVRSDYSTDK